MVLAPAGRAWAVRRRYRDETRVLETEFDTVWLVDFTPPRGDAADVVRIVEGGAAGYRCTWVCGCAWATATSRHG